MSIEITWQVQDMKRNSSDNGVFEVSWVVWAVREEKYVTEVNGIIELTPDPASDSFIPFENLTQDTVIAWVKNVLDTDVVEQEARNKLNTLHPVSDITPVVQSGTPWSGS
tara:strand:+ start:874 stop:1203 length:330 start_codon:yes stop_codon:yes gene_type:complete